MIWTHNRDARIQPELNSLRLTLSHARQAEEEQQELYQHKNDWKIIASAMSLMIFLILLAFTVLGLPIILTNIHHESACKQLDNWISQGDTNTNEWNLIPTSGQLCVENAIWSLQGVTVAGFQNGTSSTSLNGLNFPYDIYVYDNGTVLVADTMNNRITKWNPNSTVGILMAGTGAYGSWMNLLARPNAITSDELIVSDQNNYRIQTFQLNSNEISPNGSTLIGRYGQGSNLNQINGVTNLVTSKRFSSLVYICDSLNHRILVYNSIKKSIQDITSLPRAPTINPSTLAINERTFSIYITDRLNNQIQKYDLRQQPRLTTVAGWNQLNNPNGIQLDPTGKHMFIADTGNHRILLWMNGTRQGQVIAGTDQAGSNAFQLNSPTQIQFDAKFNLYVADTFNSRVQRFDLIANGC